MSEKTEPTKMPAPEMTGQPRVEKQETAALPGEIARDLNARIAALEEELKTKTEELEKSKGLISERERNLSLMTNDKEDAVRAYHGLVQKANPLVPAEMIAGASIGEINASLGKATALVTQIRAGLEKELNIQRVPPGAPGRTEPDTASMTSKEKINYGLSKARKK